MKQLTLKLWALKVPLCLEGASFNYPSSPFFATKKRQKSILVLDSTVRPCKVAASVDGPVSGLGVAGPRGCWAHPAVHQTSCAWQCQSRRASVFGFSHPTADFALGIWKGLWGWVF